MSEDDKWQRGQAALRGRAGGGAVAFCCQRNPLGFSWGLREGEHPGGAWGAQCSQLLGLEEHPCVWGWEGVAAVLLCVDGRCKMKLPGLALKFLLVCSRTSPFSLNFRYKKHFFYSSLRRLLSEIEALASRSGTALIPKCKSWEGDGINVMTSADKHL